MARALGLVALALAVAIGGGPLHDAYAQVAPELPNAEARIDFERGVALLGAQNFEAALAEFERSYALSPRPSVLLDMGVALQGLRRYAEAVRVMERYLDEAPRLAPARRASIQAGIDQMHALLGRLRIEAEPAGAVVRVDGIVAGTTPIAAPIEVGPGRHAIDVALAGRIVSRRDVTIASGEEQLVQFSSGGSEAITLEADHDQAPTATVTVRDAPTGADIRLDGRQVEPAQASRVGVGAHVLEIAAVGYAPLRRVFELSAGDAHIARLHLARTDGFRPGWFVAALVATVAAGTAAAATGAFTLSTSADFMHQYRDDPNAAALATQGIAERNATNVLLVATAVLGVATFAIFTQTRFGAHASSMDFAVAIVPCAAMANVRVRF